MKALIAFLSAQLKSLAEFFGIDLSEEKIGQWIPALARKLAFWLPIVLLYTLVLVSAALVAVFGDPVTLFGETHNKGLIVLYALALYTAASMRIVGPKEIGCRLLFGKPVDTVRSGLTFVPLGFYQLAIETSLVIQSELPTDPEKIYRGGDDEGSERTVPPELEKLGWRPPIRITFRGRSDESEKEKIPEDDPYDRRLTAEVVPFVRWRIIDLAVFIGTVGSVQEAKRQMEDTAVAVFTELLTKVSPAVALLRMKEYSEQFDNAIEELVQSWGIDMLNAELKAINFSHKLNKAVQRVVEEERNKQATILQGEGEGGKEKAILTGRTDGLSKMMKDLGISGETVIGAETARAIAGEGDKSGQKTIIAGSGGFADLIGAAAAIGETLKSKGGTQ